jgi:hypothetical protein
MPGGETADLDAQKVTVEREVGAEDDIVNTDSEGRIVRDVHTDDDLNRQDLHLAAKMAERKRRLDAKHAESERVATRMADRPQSSANMSDTAAQQPFRNRPEQSTDGADLSSIGVSLV